MAPELVAGIAFLIIGGATMLWPRPVADARFALSAKLLGVKIIPSKRTYTAFRLLGGAITAVGVAFIYIGLS